MLVILREAIRLATSDCGSYAQALRDVEAILCGEIPEHAQEFWRDIIRESDGRKYGGFAAMDPERLREYSASAHRRGIDQKSASAAGKKGALARVANTTPEQRSEWSARGAEVTNAKRRRWE